MPIIRVEMFAGRTEEQKRALVKELTDGFVRTAGGDPELARSPRSATSIAMATTTSRSAGHGRTAARQIGRAHV